MLSIAKLTRFGNSKLCYQKAIVIKGNICDIWECQSLLFKQKITRFGNTKVRYKRQYLPDLEIRKYVIKCNVCKIWKY